MHPRRRQPCPSPSPASSMPASAIPTRRQPRGLRPAPSSTTPGSPGSPPPVVTAARTSRRSSSCGPTTPRTSAPAGGRVHRQVRRRLAVRGSRRSLPPRRWAGDRLPDRVPQSARLRSRHGGPDPMAARVRVIAGRPLTSSALEVAGSTGVEQEEPIVRAVWLKELGGPEVLVPGDAPDPDVGPQQVLVEVAFAGITFVETQMRATGFGPFPLDLPLIPGNGVSGVVSGVGDHIDRSVLGTRVVTSTGGSGGYAERVAVDAAALHAVPAGLALDDAAAVLADGRTAVLQRDAAAVTAGDRVLVTAAAGGVGSLLVQLCHAAGAVVIGVVGGPEKVAVVRDLTADLVVDHRWEGWPDQVRDAVGGVDVVFDGVGGELGLSAFGLLDRAGRMVSFGAA